MCKLTVTLLAVIGLAAIANGQIPAFGGCPDYAPMADFSHNKYLGVWYEAERYFTVTELASKCISANYEKRSDGKIYVNNAITNRFTNVQRIISGVLKISLKSGEGKFEVRYNSFPVAYDTTLNVLDTDYETYSVVYSCSPIGPFGHTDSVWVLTRDRLPAGSVLQKAYGVLDKYRISRTFFVQTDQKDCDTISPPQEAVDSAQPETNEAESENNSVNDEVRNVEVKPLVVRTPEAVNLANQVQPESVPAVEAQ